MSVRILLLTHGAIGSALLAEARNIIGESLEDIRCLEPIGPEWVANKLARDDQGDGVLILADLGGSSPVNQAVSACRNYNAAIVSGLNLPMLIRTINYRDRPLAELVDLAVEGGRNGVLEHRECLKER